MLRRAFLWLSERRGVFDFVKRNGVARRVASRFVAGETVEAAIEASRKLNARGIKASLDLLGESVDSAVETHAARDEVIATLDAIARARIDGNVSVKLTQLGLDIDRELCVENMRRVLNCATEHDIFVRIDMEGSDYTESTLDLFHATLHPAFGNSTGVVIQAYLRRSRQDVERLISRGARVRLCKGAYAEPATVAYQDRNAVKHAFIELMELLLERGSYPALATHDADLIDHALDFTARRGIPSDRFEFQMLYGVRRDLQEKLVRQGYNMRVYIPFGTAWYPYLMRRLAERPANLGFIVFSVLKERIASR